MILQFTALLWPLIGLRVKSKVVIRFTRSCPLRCLPASLSSFQLLSSSFSIPDLLDFFSSPLPCCDLPGLSIFAPAISSALFPISVLRSQLKRDLLGDVPWSTHPWSTPLNHQALLCKLSDTSTCLIGSGRRRSPVRHACRKSPRERACENTHS